MPCYLIVVDDAFFSSFEQIVRLSAITENVNVLIAIDILLEMLLGIGSMRCSAKSALMPKMVEQKVV
ncbi:hypothetical protein HMPREF3091_17530 [Hafnia sp. HMSC23F03]|nr:hypothetical protein HMPREF3091_17530 [Hafnia sp. HMSC23F03]